MHIRNVILSAVLFLMISTSVLLAPIVVFTLNNDSHSGLSGSQREILAVTLSDLCEKHYLSRVFLLKNTAPLNTRWHVYPDHELAWNRSKIEKSLRRSYILSNSRPRPLVNAISSPSLDRVAIFYVEDHKIAECCWNCGVECCSLDDGRSCMYVTAPGVFEDRYASVFWASDKVGYWMFYLERRAGKWTITKSEYQFVVE